jgi:hypothetical protein
LMLPCCAPQSISNSLLLKAFMRGFHGGFYDEGNARQSGMSCNRVYYRNALHSNWVDFNVGFGCARSIDTKP